MAISTRRVSVYMIVGVLLAAAVIAAVYSSGVKLPSATSPTTDSSNGVSGSTQPVSHTGTLLVSIKDAPVDIAELWVIVDSIEVHSDENGWQNIPLLDGETAQPFDLLKLQDSSLDLSEVQLATGTYNKVRLHVSSAYSAEEAKGEQTELNVPSGKLDVIISFEIKEGGSTNLLIDMTADWVAISASGNLRPVLKATVSYAPTETSNGVQQATSTQTPEQTEGPTATPTAPVESPPTESPPVESPTPTATAPTESPTTTPQTSA